MALNPGRMRVALRLEQQTTMKNAAGEPKREWLLFRECRGEVVRTAGRELFASDERQARVPTLFRLRYVDGVLPKMRLIAKMVGSEKVYEILSAVDPDGMRSELLITCEERVGVSP